jgi:glycosyltransferase involved in cell wall biosynthesis
MKPKICTVYHVHQEVFKKHLPWFIALPLMWCEATFVPFLYRRARFVTISEDSRRDMIDLGVDPHRIGMVRCGVDRALVPGPKSDVPLVVYLGRLKAYKRVNLVIDAFERVRARVPDAVLRIAGTGDALPGLQALATQRGLQDAVFFEGFVDDDRKRELLQQAWLTVTASETEGWGISVIESNACGTPAVAFDVPGLGEAVVDGFSGSLVPEGDDLAEPMIRILTDDVLRRELDHGAMMRAAEFSWDAAAHEMLGQLMQAIVGGEIRSVDLDERWSIVKRDAGGRSMQFALSNRERLYSHVLAHSAGSNAAPERRNAALTKR